MIGGEAFYRGMMSGTDRSVTATALRGVTGGVELLFIPVIRFRNVTFDKKLRTIASLGRPTISVGNLTTGGTGKTPVVKWLAWHFAVKGEKPAILMRGYREKNGVSDEQLELSRGLSSTAESPVPVIANPNRRAGAAEALRIRPDITLFILDDAMQHRAAARDFELTLLDAREPFGYGHLLPRGLLREPLSGVARANAILLTHADEAANLAAIEAIVRKYHANVPIYRADHIISGLLTADDQPLPTTTLTNKRFFAFCGIGRSEGFLRPASRLGRCVGQSVFADHFNYDAANLRRLREIAAAAGADLLLTTEKDWSKLSRLPGIADGLPILRAQLSLRWHDDHENRLLRQIESALPHSFPSPGTPGEG